MHDIEPPEFQERFSIKEELGRGAFAEVFRCVNKKTNKDYAAKVFRKDKLTDRDLLKIEREILICARLDHPRIVRLHEVTSDAKNHYLIFDLVTGGELFEDLVSREGAYTEVVAARCMYQLLDTVSYCHSVGIAHRDLKPENILLESVESKVIKITDFGLAIEVQKDEEKLFGIAGTAHYIAPEVLEIKPYGQLVDCWACGIIMYILISGFLPFHHDDERRLNELIKNGDYDLQHHTWETVTTEGKDLIQKLLCVVPSRRFTADQALKHSWFSKIKSSKGNFLVRADTIERLKEWNRKRKDKEALRSKTIISSFLRWKKRERMNAQSSETSLASTTQSLEGKKITKK